MNARRLAAAAALALLAGCDAGPPQVAARSDLVPPSAVAGDGRVTGRVTFEGTPPPRPVLDVRCFPGSAPVRDDSVVVADDGGLANVFVHLEPADGEQITVDGSTLPPALLDQQDCRFAPHAVGVVVNQPLRLRNSDPTFHNVHYTPDRNPRENLAFDTAGETRTVSFQWPETVRARCDVHPWMSAFIGVFPTPHFAVTGTGGGFAVDGVPAGDYTLVARHEVFGELRQPVTVPADGGAPDVALAYRPPGRAS